MYRILLLDDEDYALEGLVHGIAFERLGFEKVYTACNAVVAREILITEQIDILLCDIEMPGESGLELLKWMNECQLQVVAIILTCHADFEYSRRALQLGSLDYILKPVAYEEVEAALKRAIEKVQQLERQKDVDIREKLLIKSREHLVGKIWNDILTGELLLSEKLMKELYAYNGLNYSAENQYRVFLIDLLFAHKDVDAQEDRNVRFAIWNMAEEVLIKKKGWIFWEEKEILIGIICESSPEASEENLKNNMNRFFTVCKQYLECYLNAFYSPVVPMEKIKTVYEKIREKARGQVIKKELIIQMDEELPVMKTQFPLPDIERWISLMKTGTEKEIINEICGFTRRNATEQNLNSGILEYLTGVCMQAVYAAATDWKINTDFLMSVDMQLKIHKSFRSVEKYELFVTILVQEFCKRRKSMSLSRRKSLSDKAKEYIADHLDERLLSEQIAQALFLNADYLNRIFKKETGITLSEYISNQRIEKAKELLLNSTFSVSEIAFEVGFQSFSYFSKIFKRKTGKEPSKYRKDEER